MVDGLYRLGHNAVIGVDDRQFADGARFVFTLPCATPEGPATATPER